MKGEVEQTIQSSITLKRVDSHEIEVTVTDPQERVTGVFDESAILGALKAFNALTGCTGWVAVYGVYNKATLTLRRHEDPVVTSLSLTAEAPNPLYKYPVHRSARMVDTNKVMRKVLDGLSNWLEDRIP